MYVSRRCTGKSFSFRLSCCYFPFTHGLLFTYLHTIHCLLACLVTNLYKLTRVLSRTTKQKPRPRRLVLFRDKDEWLLSSAIDFNAAYMKYIG